MIAVLKCSNFIDKIHFDTKLLYICTIYIICVLNGHPLIIAAQRQCLQKPSTQHTVDSITWSFPAFHNRSFRPRLMAVNALLSAEALQDGRWLSTRGEVYFPQWRQGLCSNRPTGDLIEKSVAGELFCDISIEESSWFDSTRGRLGLTRLSIQQGTWLINCRWLRYSILKTNAGDLLLFFSYLFYFIFLVIFLFSYSLLKLSLYLWYL